MHGKSLVLVVALFYIPIVNYGEAEAENLSEKLDNIENLIFAAELETSFCQKHSAWNFPSQLYNYVNLARQYADNLNKGRNSKKFRENLQNLLSAADECIRDPKDYWTEAWGNPVPSVPDCALDAIKKLRDELEDQIKTMVNIPN